MTDLLAQCRPWIDAALAYSGGTHAFEDVAAGIASGKMQLWPADDGCCVTELVRYPQRLVLNCFLAGGNMARIHDMIPAIEAWAKAQGCAACEMTGRAGWERRCPDGYEKVSITLRKDLT